MNDHLSAILIMVTLVAMSGFFSATETAFSSINKTRLKALAEEGSSRAATALQLAHNYDRLISTILLGSADRRSAPPSPPSSSPSSSSSSARSRPRASPRTAPRRSSSSPPPS